MPLLAAENVVSRLLPESRHGLKKLALLSLWPSVYNGIRPSEDRRTPRLEPERPILPELPVF